MLRRSTSVAVAHLRRRSAASSSLLFARNASQGYVAGAAAGCERLSIGAEGARERGHGKRGWWLLAGMMASSAVTAACESEKSEKEEEGIIDRAKNSIISNYENRIRAFSSPEKVFGTFASIKQDGELFMTCDDFIRAVMGTGESRGAAGNPSARRDARSDSGSDSALFKLVDSNGDGLISFSEYTFFLTLLSLPESEFRVAFRMFDLDGNGDVDAEEFKAMLKVLEKKVPSLGEGRSGAVPFGTTAADGARNKAKKKDEVFFPFFFGENGDQKLSFDRFRQFLKDLQLEMLRLEFKGYNPASDGTITLQQFARSLLAHVAPKDYDVYEPKVDALGSVQGSVTFGDFVTFNEMLKELDEIENAMYAWTERAGSFTQEDFARAARAVAGHDLDMKQVRVVFYLFDTDGDGTLGSEEFMAVMRKRLANGAGSHRDTGFLRMLSCCSDCIRNSGAQ